MHKNLVIVESPAKAKTIQNFLGKDYVVKSSIGHIRDMPKKDMGIDLEDNFRPTYVISSDKKRVVTDLKKSVKKAEKVYLATDDDREGEAIAWHLKEALSLAEDTPRIVFHEITKVAITKALANPRKIDTTLVEAQQARRIIDRLVGFEISPVLWRKISGAKSAGRVQSPVVRLVVEREREITKHVPSCNFKGKALLLTEGQERFEVKLQQDFNSKDEVMAFAESLLKANLKVVLAETKPSNRSPKPPFITSTLQQEASQKLGFSVKQTMNIAQNLYREGLITYMRTDSLNISDAAITTAKEVIEQTYSSEYYKKRHYKTKSIGAQEAHEAIRPTNLTKPVIPSLDDNATKLYSLIYKRTLASQMSDAKLQKSRITVALSNLEEVFIADGETLEFAGFLEVYDYMATDDKLLPKLKKGDSLSLLEFNARESFSRAKPRYTEASLVKEIEQMGIGRPSTFATMVTTVQDRKYVVKETREGTKREYHLVTIINGVISNSIETETTGTEKKKLFPTNLAYLLVDFLIKNFSNIIGYEFTAKLENNFDNIAANSITWQDVVRNFYKPFHSQIELAKDISRDETHGKRDLGDDPSGNPVSVRFGRYGAYAQIGTQDDEEKPKFATLRVGQDIEAITLDQAIELFKMPRVLGETAEKETIKANYGRFGPYIQYGKKYVSLKDVSPEEVDLEIALGLIAAKEKADTERLIKSFEGSEIQILNGRFGPYIWNGKKRGKGQNNVTIKKVFGDKEPADLTLEECEKALVDKTKTSTKKHTKKKTPTKANS